MIRAKLFLVFLFATCVGLVSTAHAQVIANDFESGTLSPFRLEGCCEDIINPPFGTRDGSRAIRFRWEQQHYNGTRSTRGVEAAHRDRIRKEGWYGFSVYLPSNEFPSNKNSIIGQLVAWHPNCETEKTIVFALRNNQLNVDGYWGFGFDLRGQETGTLTQNMPRDRWVDIVIQARVSRNNQGLMRVWFDGAPESQPSFEATNINLGTGCWQGDELQFGLYPKFGQYNYDSRNYTPGEVRVSYYDSIKFTQTPQANGFSLVNPGGATGSTPNPSAETPETPGTPTENPEAPDNPKLDRWPE